MIIKEKKYIIAIDGPAGAGKSTIAKLLAKRLKFIYIDSGAMYRSLTYKVLQNEISLRDTARIVECAKQVKIELKNCEDILRVFLDNEDITEKIRSAKISKNVSIIAEIAEVRELFVQQQKVMGLHNSIIMDGRDIGTVVFPEANLKIYLDASVEKRTHRRYEEDIKKSINIEFNNLYKELERRDKRDMERNEGPLRRAEDAHYLDTSDMGINQVVDEIEKLVWRQQEGEFNA